MKKPVASALATALVLGMASTTFAQPETEVQNPRERTAEIEQNASRNANRSDVDSEIQSLRERVAQLENEARRNRSRNSDEEIRVLRDRVDELEMSLEERDSNPSWVDKMNLTGELRYRFWGENHISDVSQLQLRLFPTFKFDDTFSIKARLTGSYNLTQDSDPNLSATYTYLEGKFDNFTINAGKMPLVSQADSNPVSGSMLFDDFFSGVQLLVGGRDDDLKVRVNAGKWSIPNTAYKANYIGAEGVYQVNDDLKAGVGYHYLKDGDAKASILAVGGGYQVTEDIGAYAAYAHNNKANYHKNAYNLEATYLGANRNEEGSWGAFAAYRYLGGEIGIAPTYDSYGMSQGKDKKGFDIGANFTPIKDTLFKVSYFHGKTLNTKKTDNTVFARASFFF